MKYAVNPMPVIAAPEYPEITRLTVADIIERLEQIQDKTKLVWMGGFQGEVISVKEENDGKVWIY